jgi:hypothetical protein
MFLLIKSVRGKSRCILFLRMEDLDIMLNAKNVRKSIEALKNSIFSEALLRIIRALENGQEIVDIFLKEDLEEKED